MEQNVLRRRKEGRKGKKQNMPVHDTACWR